MKTVVCSTLYPAMMPYLSDFLESLDAQSDPDFDLWLGLDDIEPQKIGPLVNRADVQFLESQNESIATFRQRFLGMLCGEYEAVILVDSDDLLLPNRVSRAKLALQTFDVYGCALRLIDQAGIDLNLVFNYNGQGLWEKDLSRLNIFGFSNSAFRSHVLEQCFPIQPEVVLVDWLVISSAVATGATVTFDREPQMSYRQHLQNTAAVRAPFSTDQILSAVKLVVDHYRFLNEVMDRKNIRHEIFSNNIQNRQQDVMEFAAAMQNHDRLLRYTDRINQIQSVYCWWEMIAHPGLESLWR